MKPTNPGLPRSAFVPRDLGAIVDAILDRMGLPLRPYQRAEVRRFLVTKLYWEWPSETLNAVREEVQA